jgi:glycosyltransferase involved in cell wall biosynthesis
MREELVSILIPAFNAEKWVGECIESALGQTWHQIEIIVVDDGSHDATYDRARSYRSKKLKVVRRENGGASAARNHALALAQGGYIQWLDADDLLAPDKIARQIRGAECGAVSRTLLSGSWGKFYNTPGRAVFAMSQLWEDLAPSEWLLRKMNHNLWMAIESWLVSRRLSEIVGPWDQSLSLDDDGEYFTRVVSAAEGIKFVPEARCFVRCGKVGLSSDLSLTSKKLSSYATSICAQVEALLALENSSRTRAAGVKFLNRCSIYFYPERMDLFSQMQRIASELGGRLDDPPKLRPKYQWIQKMFGWKIAKRIQYTLPALRSFATSRWERVV